jgi:hypothetical protein
VAVEGEIARDRQQIARGIGQLVEVVFERARRVLPDAARAALDARETAHVAHVHAAFE